MSGLVVACAGGGGPRPRPVTPAEIPTLQAQAIQQPSNAQIRFRLAAALMTAGRCDTAVVVAKGGQMLAPSDVLGPMVIGGCQEKDGRYDLAFATYTDFANRHPQARGVAAVRALAQFALRTQATQTAKLALARESTLTRLAPEPSTVAVLPMTIAGDSSLQPLSRGLAELMLTDLAMVRSLRLLERIQVGALLDELKLGQSGRADASTAARVGRLLRAERMVQGTATIPSRGPVQISASVVTGTGVVRPVGQVTGPFQRLLELEKQVVLDLAAQLGIAVTEAERQEILRQGPRNLAAFLAYSRGLEAMDRGRYGAAARHFRAATQADPSFQAARQGQEAATAAPAVQQTSGGEIVTVVQAVEQVTAASEPAGGGGGASGGVLSSTSLDVVPTLGDAIAQAGGVTSGAPTIDRQLTPEALGVPSIISVVNGITIIFKRPP